MIVEVSLRIVSDEGFPMLVSEHRELYVHRAPDFETNLFGSLALLDQKVEAGKEALLHQAQEYRQSEFELMRKQEQGQPPRPPERM